MDNIEQLQTDLFLGEKWLKQMGEAASRTGINLQYCMALPRQILAGLEIPAVTQVTKHFLKKIQIEVFSLHNVTNPRNIYLFATSNVLI